jgi:hypothetical protein
MVEALEPKLAERRAASAGRYSPEFMKSNQEFIAAQEANQVSKTLNVGDVAPDFTLAKAGGGDIYTLSEAVKNGPQVVSFYRGQW